MPHIYKIKGNHAPTHPSDVGLGSNSTTNVLQGLEWGQSTTLLESTPTQSL